MRYPPVPQLPFPLSTHPACTPAPELRWHMLSGTEGLDSGTTPPCLLFTPVWTHRPPCSPAVPESCVLLSLSPAASGRGPAPPSPSSSPSSSGSSSCAPSTTPPRRRRIPRPPPPAAWPHSFWAGHRRYSGLSTSSPAPEDSTREPNQNSISLLNFMSPLASS